MIHSYPVHVAGEEQEIFVVVTDIEPFRPATRYAPAEGGEIEWHLSRTEGGVWDTSIVVTAVEITKIEIYMESELEEVYYD